jgi:3-deoxy-D-manno-octulosonic-acid transferase
MTPAFALSFAIYCVLIEIVVWTALVPLFLARIAVGRATWRELRERLGAAPPPVPGGVLVHAVSAGEMRGVSPLIADAWPGRALMLTSGTRTGMAVAAELRHDHRRVQRTALLPWDRWAIRSWVRSLNVSAVVVSETEIWPGLFLACRAAAVPLFIVNGCLRRADVRRYRLIPWFFRSVLASVTWIGTQSADDRSAFIAIGAPANRVQVAGNLKVDVPSPHEGLPSRVSDELESGPILIAGSTHAPEEQWLAQQLPLLRRRYGLRAVIVPRDVARTNSVCRVVAAHSLAVVTWKTLSRRTAALHDWDVLVVDEFGWLARLYARATIVFLGGTVAHVGGHNIVEAAAFGKPIVVGPHVESIELMVRRMRKAKGIVCLPPGSAVDAFASACGALLDAPDQLAMIGEAGRRACAEESGAAARYGHAIRRRLA